MKTSPPSSRAQTTDTAPRPSMIGPGLAALASLAVGWWGYGYFLPSTGATVSGPTGPRSRMVNSGGSATDAASLGKVLAAGSAVSQWAMLANECHVSNPGALRYWLEHLSDLPNVESREIARRLVQQTAAQSFEGARAAIQGLADLDPDDPAARISLGPLARTLAAKDPMKALAMVKEFPATNGFARGIFQALADSGNSGAVFQFISENHETPGLSQAISDSAKRLAEKDLAGTQELASKMTGNTANYLNQAILTTLTKKDPAEGFAWLDTIKDPQQKSSLMGSLAEAWAEKDPIQALDFSLKQTSDTLYQMPLWRIMNRMTGQRKGEFQEWARQNMASLPQQAQQQLLSYGASYLVDEKDPMKTWDMAQTLVPGQRSNLAYYVSRAIFKKDPGQAIEWMKTLSPQEQSNVTNNIPGNLNDKEAAALLDKVRPGDALLGGVRISLLARTQPQEALAEFRSLAPAAQEQAMASPLFSMGGNSLSSSHPDIAAQMISALPASVPTPASPGEVTVKANNPTVMAAGTLAAVWVRKDAAAASHWVGTLENQDAAYIASLNLMSQWSTYDNSAATQWAGTLPAGAARDGAARSLALHEAKQGRFPEALAQAQALGDETRRFTSLGEVVSQWRRRDAAGAEAAIQALGLSEAQQAIVRQGMQNASQY